LLCTEDDNSCYRNVCKMSVVSFALAVVFIMKHKTFVKTLQIKYSVYLVLFGSKLGSSKI